MAMTLPTAEAEGSTRPAPMRDGPNFCGVALGNRVVSWMAEFIARAFSSSTDQSGWSCRSRAMMPAMCGLAIEVPEMIRRLLPAWNPVGSETPVQPAATVQVWPVWTEVMLRPGAAMSGFSRRGEPKMRRGPREEKLATVSPPGWLFSVALTVVDRAVVLIEVPSTSVVISVGMVIGTTIVASSAIAGGGEPGALLTTIVPIAPAFWQFSAWILKVQVPLLTMQMLPAMASALVRRQQLSLGSAPQAAGAVASTATTAFAVCPLGAGPNAAAPPR